MGSVGADITARFCIDCILTVVLSQRRGCVTGDRKKSCLTIGEQCGVLRPGSLRFGGGFAERSADLCGSISTRASDNGPVLSNESQWRPVTSRGDLQWFDVRVWSRYIWSRPNGRQADVTIERPPLAPYWTLKWGRKTDGASRLVILLLSTSGQISRPLSRNHYYWRKKRIHLI